MSFINMGAIVNTWRAYTVDKNGLTRGIGNTYGTNELVVPKSEIFTPRNKDGRIIAAAAIGADDGASTKYTFFHSSQPIQEAYDADKSVTFYRKK